MGLSFENMADYDGTSAKERRKTGTLSYRQKLKLQNPAKYYEYLQKQKERSKAYRKSIKELEKSKNSTSIDKQKVNAFKISSKLRQKRYREKKKMESGSDQGNNTITKPKTAPKTRKEVKCQREKWKLAKQKWRSKLSNTKKRWLREKDKVHKQKLQKSTRENTGPLNISSSVFGSKKTLYNKASKVKKVIPMSPEKFAAVVKHIASTPRKKSAIMEVFTENKNSENAKETARANHTNGEKNRLKSNFNVINISKKLRKRSIKVVCEKYGRKRRRDALATLSKKRVADFYMATSRPLPNKRYATKYGPAYFYRYKNIVLRLPRFQDLYLTY